jgi:hypothetical protein
MESRTNERDFAVVPYFIHEGMMVRNERTIKRLIIALIIAVVLMFASNAAWLYCWMQYDYVGEDTTIESSGDGIANYNYTGGDGGVIYGEDFRPQTDADEE